MDIQRYVKSFSQGQITIPKEFRNKLELGNDFWLKLTLKEDRIIAKPAGKLKSSSPDYPKKLLKIKGGWFNLKDWQKVRDEIATRHFSRD